MENDTPRIVRQKGLLGEDVIERPVWRTCGKRGLALEKKWKSRPEVVLCAGRSSVTIVG